MFHSPISSNFRKTDDEVVEGSDVESLFPATVNADGTILANKKKIKLKKDCGLFKEEPHLSLRLGMYLIKMNKDVAVG